MTLKNESIHSRLESNTKKMHNEYCCMQTRYAGFNKTLQTEHHWSLVANTVSAAITRHDFLSATAVRLHTKKVHTL